MKTQIKQAKRLTIKEVKTVEEIRASLNSDGYSFCENEDNYQTYRVDGEIGIGPSEGETVFTSDDCFSLDDHNVNYVY